VLDVLLDVAGDDVENDVRHHDDAEVEEHVSQSF
jgi:hypothetical protein